jgi:hypothetical protein
LVRNPVSQERARLLNPPRVAEPTTNSGETFLQRRTWAHMAVEWPEMRGAVSPPMSLAGYFTSELTPAEVLNIMMGDLQRVWAYGCRGWSAPPKTEKQSANRRRRIARLPNPLRHPRRATDGTATCDAYTDKFYSRSSRTDCPYVRSKTAAHLDRLVSKKLGQLVCGQMPCAVAVRHRDQWPSKWKLQSAVDRQINAVNPAVFKRPQNPIRAPLKNQIIFPTSLIRRIIIHARKANALIVYTVDYMYGCSFGRTVD